MGLLLMSSRCCFCCILMYSCRWAGGSRDGSSWSLMSLVTASTLLTPPSSSASNLPTSVTEDEGLTGSFTLMSVSSTTLMVSLGNLGGVSLRLLWSQEFYNVLPRHGGDSLALPKRIALNRSLTFFIDFSHIVHSCPLVCYGYLPRSGSYIHTYLHTFICSQATTMTICSMFNENRTARQRTAITKQRNSSLCKSSFTSHNKNAASNLVYLFTDSF